MKGSRTASGGLIRYLKCPVVFSIIVNGDPQQSIYEIRSDILPRLLNRANLEFDV